MALATDMKSLVEDILASYETREDALKDIRKDTHHIVAEAKKMMKDFAKEGEERGKEVTSFLTSSQKDRKQNFEAIMKTVSASLEDVKKDSKHWRHASKAILKDANELLGGIAKNNKKQAQELRENLKKDYKDTMETIREDLKDVRQDVAKTRKDASNMVSRFHHSRMSAQKHWASLASSKKKSHKAE